MDYLDYREESVAGRYVTEAQIADYLNQTPSHAIKEILGYSVQQRPVHGLRLGTGPIKILLWSQMHGNESTTTKALLDLMNFLFSDAKGSKRILERCSLQFIPILNPDGAVSYSRENAAGIDLNRDAEERSQPESEILNSIYEAMEPDFCFNLHDQRTIYSVGKSNKPATVSLLSPSFDTTRSLSASREKGMRLISAMNDSLQSLIPGQVGRYDDAFNPGCTGDRFQMLGTTTILVEAGHYPGDYARERTREMIFRALQTGLEAIASGIEKLPETHHYFEIPENQKLFYDILIHNSHLLNERKEQGHRIGILYEEELVGDEIRFKPVIEAEGLLDGYYGHKEYDCTIPDQLDELQSHPELSAILS